MPLHIFYLRSGNFAEAFGVNQVLDFLDQLARTGFYGKNRAEVAEQILRSSLRTEFRQGLVELPKKRRAKR